MMQETLAGSFELSGKGLHKGSVTKLIFRPAPADSGIRVKHNGNEFMLSPSLVFDTKRGTSVKFRGSRIYTVEHMVSALRGNGIDNVLVEFCSGNEPPIFDGSALEFCNAIKKTGIKKLDKEKKQALLKDPIVISEGESHLAAIPYKGFKVYYFSDFSGSGILPMEFSAAVSRKTYGSAIAPARTFGFKKEIEWLLKAGLIKGADITSAILFDNGAPVNTKLRFEDEIPRHKVLDIIGDFGLLEGELNMLIVAVKTGHRHNVEMVKKIEGILKQGS
jgi:UDP-3-O-[3-hydroxymyristoyl] N-acetylglucosamine deacetylase